MIIERIGLDGDTRSTLEALTSNRNTATAYMPAPIISVIVVCRNPGPKLHKALESIWTQTGAAIETIVIDGASSDGSREWLESKSDRIAALISEPDNGVYEAMNKGIAHAQGHWILFLGADDRLIGGALRKIAGDLAKTSAGAVAGEAAYDDGRLYPLRDPASRIRRNFAHHQATFYRRSLFIENGNFQISLRIAADYEFNLRLVKHKIRFESVRMRIATCSSGGLSDSGIWQVYAEEIFVRHLYFPTWRCWFWDAISVIRYLRKKIVRSFAKKSPE